MIVRAAVPGDAATIAEIANHFIRDTTVTFNAVEKTQAALCDEITHRDAAGAPFLVTQEAGQIVGYATYGPFRKGSGYSRTMEHTVMVAQGAQGQGVGGALMDALERMAGGCGVHSLIGALSAENDAAVRFHAQRGYTEVGRVARAGFKFGRRIDLILLQKRLSSENDTR